MDLSKSLEYFDPLNSFKGAIHVIGVGAMGSRIAELLVRLGIPKIHIWDMDIVEAKNITNQAYLHHHIGMKKTDGKYVEIPDRKEAIAYAIDNAQKGDIIILAGKGHEDYQEIKGVKYPMDERDLIADIMKERM